MGKDAYKGVFLPLLRIYRQDQNVAKLTTGEHISRRITFRHAQQRQGSSVQRIAGLRKIAAPLLPAPRLIPALATLLPAAVQQSFLHQLTVSTKSARWLVFSS